MSFTTAKNSRNRWVLIRPRSTSKRRGILRLLPRLPKLARVFLEKAVASDGPFITLYCQSRNSETFRVVVPSGRQLLAFG